jgi:hypothetical protein
MPRPTRNMIVVGAEYKGDPSWEVPPVDYFDASLHQPRLNFHRRASRTDSLPAVARADQQTLLLPSPDHGHASLLWKGLSLPQLVFALNAELESMAHSPS